MEVLHLIVEFFADARPCGVLLKKVREESLDDPPVESLERMFVGRAEGPCYYFAIRNTIVPALAGRRYPQWRSQPQFTDSSGPLQATAAMPCFSTSERSLSAGPEGRFSPRSHLLTKLGVTLR